MSGQKQQSVGTLACRVMLEGRTHSTSHDQDTKMTHIKHSWIWGNIQPVSTEFSRHNLKLQETQKDMIAHRCGRSKSSHNIPQNFRWRDGKISMLSNTLCWPLPSDDVLLPNIMFKTSYYWLMFLSRSVHICFFVKLHIYPSRAF